MMTAWKMMTNGGSRRATCRFSALRSHSSSASCATRCHPLIADLGNAVPCSGSLARRRASSLDRGESFGTLIRNARQVAQEPQTAPMGPRMRTEDPKAPPHVPAAPRPRPRTTEPPVGSHQCRERFRLHKTLCASDRCYLARARRGSHSGWGCAGNAASASDATGGQAGARVFASEINLRASDVQASRPCWVSAKQHPVLSPVFGERTA